MPRGPSAIDNALRGQPDMTADPGVQERKDELVREAPVTLDAIRRWARTGAPTPSPTRRRCTRR